MSRPILITGASGFLGAWIIPKLLARGHEVVALDVAQNITRLAMVGGHARADEIRWRSADISDEQAVRTLFESVAPAQVVHLAALQIPSCRAKPALGARVNLLGHIHVLEGARQVGARVLYTSSVAAKPRGPANAPANLYGVFKRADEEISRLYAEDYDVSSFGLRPHVVYGVGRDQGETSAITAAMRAAALSEPFRLPWSTQTCFQFADDIAESFVRTLDAPWQGAFVSDMSAEVESTADVIEAIRAAVPSADIAIEGPQRISPTDGFDTGALERAIGPLPRTPLHEGVRRTIERFQALGGDGG
ncbi:MAG: NAD(P)-dependent oxidoreductase [Burkholderiaceae bacterium]